MNLIRRLFSPPIRWVHSKRKVCGGFYPEYLVNHVNNMFLRNGDRYLMLDKEEKLKKREGLEMPRTQRLIIDDETTVYYTWDNKKDKPVQFIEVIA